MESKFDRFSGDYEDLLRDPVRDRFAASGHAYFHVRKVELLTAFLKARGIEPASLSLLDVGCGRGDFLALSAPRFGRVKGCDVSGNMLIQAQARSIGVRQQQVPTRIPYRDNDFDVLTANCVFHHVPAEDRMPLFSEMRRVLRPSGMFCLVEHNPLNPVTRGIVKRTPVDADAHLLTGGLSRRLARSAGFEVLGTQYFLYLPEKLYNRLTRLENLLAAVPLGGQYALFCRNAPSGKPANSRSAVRH